MIDGTEKPKIPSKFAKRTARYNEFRYKSPHKRNYLLDGLQNFYRILTLYILFLKNAKEIQNSSADYQTKEIGF